MVDGETPPPVEWGVATRSRPGEVLSGDRAVIAARSGGALVAAIDGVGHGRAAAGAADRAVDTVSHIGGEDLIRLIEACHRALVGTRGAAISAAFVSSRGRVTWLGVGNVAGWLVSGDPVAMRPKGSLALGRGVVGHELPSMQIAALPMQAGDVLVLATDGVAAGFADSLSVSGSSQAISERILADHGGRRDDALVVAVRYLGVRAA